MPAQITFAGAFACGDAWKYLLIISKLIPNKEFDTHEADAITDDGRNFAENTYNRDENLIQVTPGCSEVLVSPVNTARISSTDV